jgi:hypothetical protein
MTSESPSGTPRPGWWSRNWKWFVPVGCLSIIVVAAASVAAILALVFGAMRSADVYKDALSRARANPEVGRALGTPIDAGWMMSGHINVTNRSGDADIEIPISGPKGKGSIRAVATKSEGKWTYSRLVVQPEHGDAIDLLPPSRYDL